MITIGKSLFYITIPGTLREWKVVINCFGLLDGSGRRVSNPERWGTIFYYDSPGSSTSIGLRISDNHTEHCPFVQASLSFLKENWQPWVEAIGILSRDILGQYIIFHPRHRQCRGSVDGNDGFRGAIGIDR
eukprot:Lithocolla_globosa_v1_NODE_438_length_4052_cov_8.871404.p2 type:complete len:131 gc:universal NODE_438_length_4052_cov_8.871404:1847-2239(+)